MKRNIMLVITLFAILFAGQITRTNAEKANPLKVATVNAAATLPQQGNLLQEFAQSELDRAQLGLAISPVQLNAGAGRTRVLVGLGSYLVNAVGGCNDCHTPPGLVGKYATKASNGFWHSFYFTAGGFHEPIQITPRNLAVTEQACQKCHTEITDAIDPAHGRVKGEALSCLKCHRSVGHLH